MKNDDRPMQKCDKWSGRYRGVGYEVSCHYRDWYDHDERNGEPRRACWTFYIYIPEQMIPEAKRDRFIAKRHDPERMYGDPRFYDYYATTLAELDWHGDITYYELHSADLPGHRMIQAGCDYSHGFDGGRSYTAEYVERDAKKCIDSLHANHPDLLVCDWYDGSFHPREEMEETPQGLLSAQGKAKIAKWNAENAERDAKETPK